ncbi:nucleotide exchange factor GrpE [Vallicoccus soli]|uniref:Protein GrpE n=1 Tax=Vallicoccus soli TaxID=2339232 RepID=A0A3A3YWR4_9ACTN|nr:nucleotide exchange factor GrpE [Vallicoccus soli]
MVPDAATAAPGRPGRDEEPPEQGPVVRDKRRIDPRTGALREPADGPAAGPGADAEGAAAGPSATGDDAQLQQQLAERTADLQRVSAEYANYRRRVDRDREAVREQALGGVLAGLLPVLDDLDRAAAHGELQGGFKAVADSLQGVVGKLGLERFGAEGEAFDPTRHEALMQEEAGPDGVAVDGPTVVRVLQPGYRLGERVLRPARVAVAGA